VKSNFIAAAIVMGAVTPLTLPRAASATELSCPPPVVFVGDGQAAKDPITSLSVLHEAGAWRVQYRLMNGATIERASQYDIRDTTDDSRVSWSGTLYRRSQLRMVGEILVNKNDANAYGYRETIYDYAKGGQVTMQMMAFNCQRLDVAPTPPPVSAAPPSRPAPEVTGRPAPQMSGGFTVPIISDGNKAIVRVTLGGIEPVPMLIDTGSSGLAITETFAKDLVAHGDANEMPGTVDTTLANGSVEKNRIITIRQIAIGGHVLRDVEAMVGPDGSPLLLGFPVLNQLGKFTIDTANSQLIFG